jgi:hypothetical protein
MENGLVVIIIAVRIFYIIVVHQETQSERKVNSQILVEIELEAIHHIGRNVVMVFFRVYVVTGYWVVVVHVNLSVAIHKHWPCVVRNLSLSERINENSQSGSVIVGPFQIA